MTRKWACELVARASHALATSLQNSALQANNNILATHTEVQISLHNTRAACVLAILPPAIHHHALRNCKRPICNIPVTRSNSCKRAKTARLSTKRPRVSRHPCKQGTTINDEIKSAYLYVWIFVACKDKGRLYLTCTTALVSHANKRH